MALFRRSNVAQLREAAQSQIAEWGDRWTMLLAWRSNSRAIRRCLADLDAAGIFASSPDSVTLCEQIADWRKRPIHLIPYAFVRTISGIVIGRHDYDCIYFADLAHPLLGQQAILHELSHLLLGHVTPCPNPGRDDALSEVDIAHALKRSCFDHRREVQAERMAYLLRERWQASRPLPRHLQRSDDLDDAEQRVWDRYKTYLDPLDG